MGIVMEDSLLNPAVNGLAQVVLMKSTGFTKSLRQYRKQEKQRATIVEPTAEDDDITSLCNIQ